jgi:hypothetical protein
MSTTTSIRFDNFEGDINPTIVQRGRDYWQDGAVVRLLVWRSGQWHAEVQGSERYKIRIKRHQGKLAEAKCTCLYDDGPICKHIVAVLFAIRDGNEQAGSGMPPRDERQLITNYLETLSAPQLNNLVWQAAAESDDFFNHLALQAQKELGGTDKREYVRILRRSLSSAQDRHGFIDYVHSRQAAQGANELLRQADEVEKRRPRAAIMIYQAVIETLVPALQSCDDSNGDIGGAIDSAMERLDGLVEALPDEKLKTELFHYLLKESGKKHYRGWDWGWSMLETAGKMAAAATRPDLFSAIDVLIQQGKRSEYGQDFEQERAALIKLAVIKRLDGEAAAEDFMRHHIHHSGIREQALEHYFAKNDLATCLQLATEGAHQARSKWPGLVIRYNDWLLRIAKKQKDAGAIHRLQIDLFVDSHEWQYFTELKKRIPSRDWSAVRKDLINRLQRSQRHDPHTIAEVYKREGMLDDLCRLIQQEQYLLLDYYKWLGPKYKNELVPLFRKMIYDGIEYAGGRSQYQEKADLLYKMKDIKASKEAEAIVNDLLATYPLRPAMREELRRVSL